MNLNQDQEAQLTFLSDELEAGKFENVLLFFETVPGFYPLLPSLIGSSRFRVRAGAHLLIEELVEQGKDLNLVAEWMEPMLESKEQYIQGEAISALETIGTPRQIPLLQSIAKNSLEPFTSMALEAIEEIEKRFPS